MTRIFRCCCMSWQIYLHVLYIGTRIPREPDPRSVAVAKGQTITSLTGAPLVILFSPQLVLFKSQRALFPSGRHEVVLVSKEEPNKSCMVERIL